MQGRRAERRKKGKKIPAPPKKCGDREGPSVRDFGPTIDVVLEVVELVVAVNVHPRLPLLYGTSSPRIAKCLFEGSKFVIWNFWDFRFHFVLLIIEPPLYHGSHIGVKSLIFGPFLLFFVCTMQRQQVSCKGGERSADLGHEKTPSAQTEGVTIGQLAI